MIFLQKYNIITSFLKRTQRVLALVVCGVLGVCRVSAQQDTLEQVTFIDSSIVALVNDYRFAQAVTMLEQEMEAQKKANVDVSKFSQEVEKVERCEQMISVTENVCFIDSLVLPKSEMLSRLPLSAEIGFVGALSEVNPQLASKYDTIRHLSSYMNSIKDRTYLTMKDSAGVNKLYSSHVLMGNWTDPLPLSGVANLDGNQGYPFMCVDGTTFYYSMESAKGLGGYDIYVTRYIVDGDRFLTPELLSMPYNSPANDYFYIYDEGKGIGCFATDRRQPKDSVCIYFFIPNLERHVHNADSLSEDSLRNYARILSIKDTWKDTEKVAQFKEQLYKKESSISGATYKFIINDDIVYTNLEQFKKESAREIAEHWIRALEQLNELQENLEQKRNEYSAGNNQHLIREFILNAEQKIVTLRKAINRLEKDMRREELR